MTNGSLKTLCYKGFFNFTKASKAWETIFNGYIKEFGLPQSYKNYLKKMVKSIQLYDKAYNELLRLKDENIGLKKELEIITNKKTII